MIKVGRFLRTSPKFILFRETKVSMLKWKGREPKEVNPNSFCSRAEGNLAFIVSLPTN